MTVGLEVALRLTVLRHRRLGGSTRLWNLTGSLVYEEVDGERGDDNFCTAVLYVRLTTQAREN